MRNEGSLHEPALRPISSSKPELKPKPPIAKKPSLSTDSQCPQPAERGREKKNLEAKPRRPAVHFSQRGSAPAARKIEERTQSCWELKAVPSVKHRPQTFCAPPLPLRNDHSLRKDEERDKYRTGREGNAVLVSGNKGRSNGKEVEAGANDKVERQQDSSASTSLLCEKSCTCICHLKRPNMRLVWVPINEKEKEETEGSEKEKKKERHGGGRGGEQKRFNSGSSRETNIGKKMVQAEKVKLLQGSNMITVEFPQKAMFNTSSQAVMTSCCLQPHLSLHNSGNKEEKRFGPQSDPKEKDTNTPPPIPPRAPYPLDRSRKCHSVYTHHDKQLCPPAECSSPSKSPLPRRAPSQTSHSKEGPNSTQLNSKDEQDDALADWEKVDMKEEKEEQPPVPHARKASTDLEIRLQDEPLYQQYRDIVITKAIQRQAVCHDVSDASMDHHMGSGAPGDGARMRAKSCPTQSTLWQDLTLVRDSGVLEKLSPAECKRQESMFEVLTSEASYVRSLRVLTDHFLDSRDLDETLIIRDKKTLFSNILRVREVSERFLKDLEERFDENLVISDICDIIHYHAQNNFSVYVDYIRNQIYQEKTYSSLMQKNVQFATVITRLQESTLCQRLPFMSFLLLPFQRITRIKMLIENILKRTQEGTNEEQTASKALASVSQIIQECNAQVGRMKQMEELIHIAKMLEFDKLKAIPIISQTRFLEKRGELHQLTKGGTLFSPRPKFTPIYLFLFNDLLVFTCRKSSERYIVTDHAHRSLVQVRAIGRDKKGPGFDHCFCLTLLENHQGCPFEHVLKAPTQSDMHRWMAAFPNLIDQDREKDEVVYEDWDCPQVQCLDQYVAQQADELNLEPTDIINVVRKTNEGWYEGVRLSDGQKGWFPADKVQEITNEHVRRRNIREQYRIIRAAAHAAAEEPGQASRPLYQNM